MESTDRSSPVNAAPEIRRAGSSSGLPTGANRSGDPPFFLVMMSQFCDN